MNSIFYQGNQVISGDFKGERTTSDGSVILLEKIERKTRCILRYCNRLFDRRKQCLVKYSMYTLLKYRVYTVLLGYEDCNDVEHLKDDPALGQIFGGRLPSQPTLSRFENSVGRSEIWSLSEQMIEEYITTLKDREEMIIDVDSTDDKTHGSQEFSLFNGFYDHTIYNQLFFHDGQTGQIILPVLRPGNVHTSKWAVNILERMIDKIREVYPQIRIKVRADAGYSSPEVYTMLRKKKVDYCIGIPSNRNLRRKIELTHEEVYNDYYLKGKKHIEMTDFDYKASSWCSSEKVVAKIESTGKGLDTRFVVTNLEGTAKDIYYDFYVKRGDASENRIKEVKNMCFADRLSDHRFWANYLRLLISSIAFNLGLRIRQGIQETDHEKAHNWQVSSIRTYLLKVAATVKITKTRVHYRFSKSFVHQKLLEELLFR